MSQLKIIYFVIFFCISQLNASGIIVLLNGPSSVGKTSIQKSLQKKAPQTYLRVGIDTFFDALIEEPDLSLFELHKKFDQYTAQGEYIRGIEFKEDERGNPIVPLKIGPAGDRIIFGMHRAIAEYANVGNNLIVDYILYKSSWIDDLATSLNKNKVYLIKVHAPLEVIESREQHRNTSPKGHARSHYETVHTGMSYDLELDTSVDNADECADKILNFIKTNPNPQALKSIH